MMLCLLYIFLFFRVLHQLVIPKLAMRVNWLILSLGFHLSLDDVNLVALPKQENAKVFYLVISCIVILMEKNLYFKRIGLNHYYFSGHFGYIELPVPIYHPSHVTELKKILSLVCLSCLRLKKTKVSLKRNVNT